MKDQNNTYKYELGLFILYLFVKRMCEVRKLGQNLARGGGGAGHGILSTMAESLREREREIVEFDEMDKEEQRRFV